MIGTKEMANDEYNIAHIYIESEEINNCRAVLYFLLKFNLLFHFVIRKTCNEAIRLSERYSLHNVKCVVIMTIKHL